MTERKVQLCVRSGYRRQPIGLLSSRTSEAKRGDPYKVTLCLKEIAAPTARNDRRGLLTFHFAMTGGSYNKAFNLSNAWSFSLRADKDNGFSIYKCKYFLKTRLFFIGNNK